MTSVLISGAGIAGTTAAYWLARHGFTPTVVERAQGQRSSGNPVDIRRHAVPIADAMGVMPALRERATRPVAMKVIDRTGRQVARMPMQSSPDEVEIPRADLAAVLYGAARGHAEFRFDDSIVALRQDSGGVDVSFERAAPQRFDLVLGADGLHSAVRRLTFGSESDFVRHLGVYVATLPLDEPVDDPQHVLMYNTPGRLVTVHPSRDAALLAFIFRSAAIPGFDYRDTEQHKRILLDAYAGVGWRAPEFLEKVRQTQDLYYDSVSRVRLPAWSRGRIALLGDAASCVSLFGDGSSLAMTGAHTLAAALAETTEHTDAFRRFEAQHRTLTEPKRRGAARAAALIVPRTRLGIAARNAAARLFLSRR